MPQPVPEAQLRPTTVPVINNLTSSSRYVQTYFLSTEAAMAKPMSLEAMASGERTIVIQPGSRYIKIGLAKDAFPKVVPHVIAYKEPLARMEVDEEAFEDEWQLPEDDLKEYLHRRHKSAKKKPPPNLYGSLVTYNKSVEAQSISAHNDAFAFEWTETEDRLWIAGKEVLRLDPSAGYRQSWPMKRGSIDRLAYSSYREAIIDLERIWGHCIRKDLGIGGSLSEYAAMLIVPANATRWELRAYAELVLSGLGLRAVSFIMEPVACTFGAGISGGCVVDLGAQTVTIACIDEGIVQQDSLVKLDWGGDDLTKLLHQILNWHGFPYHLKSLRNPLDFELLNDLRVNFCTLDEEDVGAGSQAYEFFVRRPGKPTLQYHFKVFEERLLPLLALFEEGAPWLNGFEEARRKQLEATHFITGAYDVQDEVAEAKAAVELADDSIDVDVSSPPLGTAEQSQPQLSAASSWNCEWAGCALHGQPFTNLRDAVEHVKEAHVEQQQCRWDACPCPDMTAADAISRLLHVIDHLNRDLGTFKPSVENQGFSHMEPASPAAACDSLPAAILRSVKATGGYRSLASILLVGGTSKSAHLQPFLLQALLAAVDQLGLPADQLPVFVDFVPNTRDLDPAFVGWKGGAVASKLEGAQDTWIGAQEWRDWGPKLLRERLPFQF